MKDNAISNLKAVMLCGVVVNHAWASAQYVTTPQVPPVHLVSWFSNILIVSGLPVFFFLSGYFAGRKSEELLTLKGYWMMLGKKIRSLILPYLAWNLLFIVFYLSVGGVVPRIGQRVPSFHLDTVDGFLSSLLGVGRNPIDAPLWFVRDLFLIFLISPIVVWLIKYVQWVLFGVVLYLLCFGFGFYGKWYSFVFFSLGILAAQKNFELRSLAKFKWVAIPIWLLASISVYWGMVHYGVYYPDPRIMIWFFVVSVFAWLGLLPWMEFRPTNMFVRYITPSSFFIYCAHFLVCSMFLHSIAGKVPDSPIKLMLLYGVFIGVGGITMIAVFHFTKRYFPNVLSIFAGGRLS